MDNLLEAVASMRLGLHFIEKNIPSSTWVFDLVPIELNPQVCFEFQQGTCGIYYIYLFIYGHATNIDGPGTILHQVTIIQRRRRVPLPGRVCM